MNALAAVLGAIRGRRVWLRPGAAWRAAAVAVCVFALAPVAAVLLQAASPGGESTIGAAAFIRALAETALLLVAVLIPAALVGVCCAWLVTMCDFPGRRLFGWTLPLPFAAPAYITAFVYADAFPAFRGLAAAAAMLALALYPYIYIFARASFLQQACHIHTSARVLGCSPRAVFWRVSLPMARPAIAAGAALAAMETLNDLAVAQHYGVNTLGAAIFDVWLNRGDLAGAARLAAGLMLVVVFIVHLEAKARERQKQFVGGERCYACDCGYALSGIKAAAAFGACALPVAAGFVIPLLLLIALSADAGLWNAEIMRGMAHSLALAAAAAAATLAPGMIVVYALRHESRPGLRWLARAAQSGYAFPGAILALGLFAAAAAAVQFGEARLGLSLRGLLYGGVGLLVCGYAARFLIIAIGALDAGFDKISPRLGDAARCADFGRLRALLVVYLPLLRPALFAAALLIFVDAIKELPMTLILRPFNFETLATYIYQYASDEALAQCAPAALLLIAAACAPVVLLDKMMSAGGALARGRNGMTRAAGWTRAAG